MSLRTQINAATRTALKQMSSISEAVRYQQVVGDPIYNVETGSPTRQVRTFAVRGFFTSFKEDAVDGNFVQPGDQRLTFDVLDIPFTPKLADFVFDGAGLEWEVIAVKTPPPKIIHILTVRRP